jgi:branched-chain amino acid transport system permease protein
VAALSTAPQAASSRLRLSRGDAIRAGVIVVLVAIVMFVVPALVSLFWVDTFTSTAIYSIVALGLGLLVGRVGMFSLGQVAVLGLGGWVAARLLFATSLPYPVVLVMAGLITVVMGTAIGLPALRVSGLYLALVTLMLAGAITIVLSVTNFPNGAGGFLGYFNQPTGVPPAIRRPAIAASDPAFFRYTVMVALAMFLLVLWHIRSKPGRAWAAIRQSEPAALAAGVNVTLYKLWAFALASFVTGVAGGLLGSSAHVLYTYQFPTQASIVLLAVVLMGGVYSLWGAVIAAILLQTLPALFTVWNFPANLPTVLFGVGVLQVLTMAPRGLAYQVPKDIANLGRLLLRLARRAAPATERAP